MSHVEFALQHQKDVLMEEIIANYHANTQTRKWCWWEGPYRPVSISSPKELEIAKTLNAKCSPDVQGTDTPEQLNERIELTP